jgi:hypothetical protein
MRSRGQVLGTGVRLIETQHIRIAARGAEIAHPTTDECDALAVARYHRRGQLFARPRRKHYARSGLLEHVQFGNPPLTVAITRCRRTHEAAVRQEIEFINVQIRRGHEFERRSVNLSDSLFIRLAADIADQGDARLRAAHHLVGLRRRQYSESVARTITQSVQSTVETEYLPHLAAPGVSRVNLGHSVLRPRHEEGELAGRAPGGRIHPAVGPGRTWQRYGNRAAFQVANHERSRCILAAAVVLSFERGDVAPIRSNCHCLEVTQNRRAQSAQRPAARRGQPGLENGDMRSLQHLDQ